MKRKFELQIVEIRVLPDAYLRRFDKYEQCNKQRRKLKNPIQKWSPNGKPFE